MTKSASAKASLAGRAGDQRLEPVGLVRVDPALAEQLVDLGVHVAHALVDPLLVEVGQHDRHLEARANSSASWLAISPAPTTPTLVTGRARDLSGHAGRPLGAPLHQVEGVEPGAQLVAHDQVGERLVLGGEALVVRRGAGELDQLERAVGRRRRAVHLACPRCPWPRASAASQASPRSISGRVDGRLAVEDARGPDAATAPGSRPARRSRRRCRARRPAWPLSIRFWFSGFSMITVTALSAPIRFGSSWLPPQPGTRPRKTSGSAMAGTPAEMVR